MTTIYRVIHPIGWVEFISQSEASVYRDKHHSGCEIQEIQRDLSEHLQD
jgi:hypothetical protein